MAQILVVDDEEIVCSTLKRLLEREDMVVSAAGSANDGLVLMEKNRYDLLIIDIKMPGMDGISLLKKVRAEYGGIPVVICTGFSTSDAKEEALKNGANHFITKPFEAEEVLNSVKEHLRKKD